MSTDTGTARNCFEENIRLFGNAKTQPEKYNLYNGLASLAEAIEGLENDLRGVSQQLRQLK